MLESIHKVCVAVIMINTSTIKIHTTLMMIVLLECLNVIEYWYISWKGTELHGTISWNFVDINYGMEHCVFNLLFRTPYYM